MASEISSGQTFDEKKEYAGMLLAKHSAQRDVPETTPKSITSLILSFAHDLCLTNIASQIPVIQDDYGLYGWCSDGVLEKMKHDAGAILFGWTIWEWPKVMLTAEFHAVWENPDGVMIDITPKPQKETSIVFVPDHSYPSDFDFDKRPRNRRRTLQVVDDSASAVAAVIEGMKPPQMAYERQRAEKAGKTLEEWLLIKQPINPLPRLVDELILVCNRKDEAWDAMPGEGFVSLSSGYLAASKQAEALIKRIAAITQR